jgi:tetratricopeptide (TPR) repeat protein
MLLFAALLPAYGQQGTSTPVPGQKSGAAPVPASPVMAAPQNPAATQAAPLAVPCSDKANPKPPNCPTKEDRRRAAKEFRTALKLQKKRSRMRQAFEHFKAAAALAPDDPKYLSAREVARQELVSEAIQAGSRALAAGNDLEALVRFREALQIDPDNDFARQRLSDALPRLVPASPDKEKEDLGGVISLQPQAGVRKFHLSGNTRDIISQVTLAYGITALFDDSTPSRSVRLDMGEATWQQAATVLSRLTKTIWTPLSARQVLFASDTDENRRNFFAMSLRTFYLPQATTPQALTEISTAMRTLFEIRFSAVDTAEHTLTVRADTRTLDAVSEFVHALRDQLPEVTFQLDVFQVSREFTRVIGASVPSQFQVFNIPTELAQLASTINQANSTSLSALLAQLQGQQNSLLSQPFAVFGGGITLSALTIPSASFSFSRDLSSIRQLQSMTLRASQGAAAVMKIGERYPILNSTYSSSIGSTSLTQLLGGTAAAASGIGSLAAYPSFTYEDLGFNLKATPMIHRDNSIDIKLEMQIRSLGTQTVNGVPIINNQEFNGIVSAKNGESVAVAGNLTQSESRILNGYSLLTSIPGLANRNVQEEDDELLVVLTPHVVIANPQAGPPILLPNTMPR